MQGGLERRRLYQCLGWSVFGVTVISLASGVLVQVYLTFAGLAFAVLLWPTIRDRDAQMPLETSFSTATLLAGMAIAYARQGLTWAAATAGLAATGWAIIAVLRHPRPPGRLSVGERLWRRFWWGRRSAEVCGVSVNRRATRPPPRSRGGEG